jgi:hypothetical protein
MGSARLRLAMLAACGAATVGLWSSADGVGASARLGAAGAGPTIGGCPVLPPDNPWNQRVDRLPVAAGSARYVAAIGLGAPVHPDFGTVYNGAPNGIPYVVVGRAARRAPVHFQYASESDRGPYPLPPGVPIEGGRSSTGDRHVIVVDRATCVDYELYAAYPHRGYWSAGSGAVFHLRSDALRPAGWTSADAAGLPILPGLARFSEVAAGAINHALRFTAPCTAARYVYPARHLTSGTGCGGGALSPPMGLRVRLKASVSLAGLPRQARIVALALKRYGAILADNGSPWYISGAPDGRWDDAALHLLDHFSGRDFEVVDTRSLPHPGL